MRQVVNGQMICFSCGRANHRAILLKSKPGCIRYKYGYRCPCSQGIISLTMPDVGNQSSPSLETLEPQLRQRKALKYEVLLRTISLSTESKRQMIYAPQLQLYSRVLHRLFYSKHHPNSLPLKQFHSNFTPTTKV